MNIEQKQKLLSKPNSWSPAQIWRRMIAPIPKFWKPVRAFNVAIGTLSGAVLAIPATMSQFGFLFVLPHWLTTACAYGLMLGAVGVFMTSLPVDWNKVENQQPTD